MSSHSPILRHGPPPLVAIHSPSSYSTSKSFVKNEPDLHARNGPSKITTRQERDADVAGIMVGPIPNRATKPKLQSQSIRRPMVHKSVSELHVGSQGRYKYLSYYARLEGEAHNV